MSFLGHGLLLLNDGLYFDAWLFDTHSKLGNYDLLYQWQRDHGRPLSGVYYIIAGILFSNIFVHKIFIFILILLSAFIIHDLAYRFGFGKRDSLLVGLVSMLFPAYQTYADHSSNAQIVNQAQFYLGVWLILASSKWRFTVRSLAILSAIVFFIFSFSTESYWALYFAFLLLLVCEKYVASTDVISAIKSLFSRQWFLAVLPFAYFLITRIYFAPQGLYKDYTQPSLDNVMSPLLWARFLNNSIVRILQWCFGSGMVDSFVVTGGKSWILWVASGAVIFLPLFDKWSEQGLSTISTKKIFIIGVFLMLFASLPFVSGARIPSLHGYESRYNLMVGLAIAVLYVCFLRIIESTLLILFSLRTKKIITNVIIGIVLLCFINAQFVNYLAWQAEWVQDRSWLENLKDQPLVNNISIFELNDQWDDFDNEVVNKYFQNDRTLELSVMLQRTLNNDKYPLGLTGNPIELQLTGVYRQIFFLDKYDIKGCRAEIIVRRTQRSKNIQQFEMVSYYWYVRIFDNNKLLEYLKSLTDVKLVLQTSNNPKCYS
jgi:hypothetical protein